MRAVGESLRGVPWELLRRAAVPVALGHTRPSHAYPSHREPFGRSQPAPQGLRCLSTAVVAGARLALAAAQPASDGSHTGSPPTAIRALQTLSVAPQSRSMLLVQPPPGGCTTTRASAVRTSRSGQPAGRARRQLDSARGEVSKASSARRDKRDYQSTPMDLGAGTSALDQKQPHFGASRPTSGRTSTFFSGRFVRRAARADEGRRYHLIADTHIGSELVAVGYCLLKGHT